MDAEGGGLVERQDVETLAQLTYELANPMGVLWSQRRSVIRDGWLDVARRRLSEVEAVDMREPAGSGKVPDHNHGLAVARSSAVLGAFKAHGQGHRPLSLHTLIRETGLDPAVLVRTVRLLVIRGVLVEISAPMDPSGQAAFRLLGPGFALLADGSSGPRSRP